ncbi:hypothetical protein BKA70DRAFT_1472231 [Coprinopsis sp. MPI-PUGE-AT-0042]|nr:hypothetical protein BKA70DRAFT_1472231 [Coprinopsis sp. MPI-PUGE-AT-0042]
MALPAHEISLRGALRALASSSMHPDGNIHTIDTIWAVNYFNYGPNLLVEALLHARITQCQCQRREHHFRLGAYLGPAPSDSIPTEIYRLMGICAMIILASFATIESERTRGCLFWECAGASFKFPDLTFWAELSFAQGPSLVDWSSIVPMVFECHFVRDICTQSSFETKLSSQVAVFMNFAQLLLVILASTSFGDIFFILKSNFWSLLWIFESPSLPRRFDELGFVFGDLARATNLICLALRERPRHSSVPESTNSAIPTSKSSSICWKVLCFHFYQRIWISVNEVLDMTQISFTCVEIVKANQLPSFTTCLRDTIHLCSPLHLGIELHRKKGKAGNGAVKRKRTLSSPAPRLKPERAHCIRHFISQRSREWVTGPMKLIF